MIEKMESADSKVLPIIIKAGVQGSAEALSQALTKLSNNEVSVNIVHSCWRNYGFRC